MTVEYLRAMLPALDMHVPREARSLGLFLGRLRRVFSAVIATHLAIFVCEFMTRRLPAIRPLTPPNFTRP